MIRDAKLYLEAGAYMVMVESEGITEGVRKPRWDVVEALVREFGLEKLMFEAAERPVFRWYIYTFGPHVNLFIDHSQILEVTALRTELWAPKKPWGKVYFTKRP
jgi:phosphosulfolactate synthase (CoM biosynthesis protein A)